MNRLKSVTIHIIYHRLFDMDGRNLSIGGIQTYLINLAQALTNAGFDVQFYQLANFDWETKIGQARVLGVGYSGGSAISQKSSALLKEVMNNYSDGDIVIWGTYNIAIKHTLSTSISIQHGISFDYLPSNSSMMKIIHKFRLETIYQWMQRRKASHFFLKSKFTVLVDYNFLNWIRTMVPRRQLKNVFVIPNFTHISDFQSVNQKSDETIQILFARRFVIQRGVLITIDVAKRILEKYSHVKFTFAGEGEYEELLKKEFAENDRVEITRYTQNETLEFHSKHHICIVPTYGSEGTSLSLLEAMTSGCVPIATNVGGMTNIILDHFNGFLVDPDVDAIEEKLKYLIENKNERLRLSTNAKNSVDSSFSYEIWSKKWISVIHKLVEQ